jgi:hypothetical protein
MHKLPLTGLAFAVKVEQGGLAMHMVPPWIHEAPYQPFNGMELGLAAPDTGVRHGALLSVRDTVPKRLYCQLYSLKVNYVLFSSIKGM